MNPIIESKAYGDGYNDGLEHGRELGKTEAIEKFMNKIEKDARYEHPIDVIEVDRCRFIARLLKEKNNGK